MGIDTHLSSSSQDLVSRSVYVCVSLDRNLFPLPHMQSRPAMEMYLPDLFKKKEIFVQL